MIFVDIETLDFFQDAHIKSLHRAEQIAAMRFGCGVTYNSESGEWREWLPDQIGGLYYYLFLSGQKIVGWNIIDFDVPVIVANHERAGVTALEIEYEATRKIDLFAEIRRQTGRWYRLEDVAVANLNRSKLADGQKAAEWLRSGDPVLVAKALAYCREDVQIVVDLYAMLVAGQSLILPRRPTRNELNDIRWGLSGWEHIVGEDGVLGTR